MSFPLNGYLTTQEAIVDGMVAYWPMNETSGSTVTDVLQGFNGTALINQNDGITTGKFNNARLMPQPNGADGILLYEGTYDPDYDLLDWSIVVWFKPTLGSWMTVYRFYKQFGSSFEFNIQDNGAIYLANAYSNPNPVVSNNNWHCVALCANASGYGFYVDGELKYTYTGNKSDRTLWLKGIKSTLGAWDTSGYPNQDSVFQGTLDEVGIWNRALTIREVMAIWNSSNGQSIINPNRVDPTTILDGLEHYWPMNDIGSNIVSDQLGDTPGTVLNDQDLSSIIAAKFNNGREFGGTNGCAGIELYSGTADSSRTLYEWGFSAWVKTGTQENDYVTLVNFNNNFDIFIESNGTINVERSNDGYYSDSGAWVEDQWHWFFVCGDLLNWWCYLDNVLLYTGTNPYFWDIGYGLAMRASSIYLGTWELGEGLLIGQLDEVAVWNRILSASERDQLWNNGDGLELLSIFPTPPIAYGITSYFAEMIGTHLLRTTSWQKPTTVYLSLLSSTDPLVELSETRIAIPCLDDRWSAPSEGDGAFSNSIAIQSSPLTGIVVGWAVFLEAVGGEPLIIRKLNDSVLCTSSQPGPSFSSGQLQIIVQ